MVGFDDFPLADMLRPGISVIAQDTEGMGRLAAELLFRRLDGDETPMKTYVLPTTLIARGSGEIAPPAVIRWAATYDRPMARAEQDEPDWVRALGGAGAEHDQAVKDLHAMLVRVARTELHRRSGRAPDLRA